MRNIGVDWYAPITEPVLIRNMDMVPFLLQATWLGQGVKSDLQIEVVTPRKDCGDLHVKFHTVFFDEMEKSPCRRGRLRLEGCHDNQDIFALLHIDVDQHTNKEITFSPVPFGPNGKPKVPYKNERLTRFLDAAKVSTSRPGNVWTKDSFAKEVCEVAGIPDYEFGDGEGWYWLVELEKLGLIRCVGKDIGKDVAYKSAMNDIKFEEVFALKLPIFHTRNLA